MIRNIDVANKVSLLMVECLGKLDQSIALVKKECSDEEFKTYRKAVGKIMGYMVWEVMKPIYEKHPEIKPLEWSD